MITTACPICNEDLRNHHKEKREKCLWRFTREARNPVVYASRSKLICPTCGEEMLDHNSIKANKCVDQFVNEVDEMDIL